MTAQPGLAQDAL